MSHRVWDFSLITKILLNFISFFFLILSSYTRLLCHAMLSHLVWLYDLIHQSTWGQLSSTTSWSLVISTSIELVMLSNYLILCHSLLLFHSIFLSIKVFSKDSALHIRWPRFWSFKFSISLDQYSGLISLRID